MATATAEGRQSKSYSTKIDSTLAAERAVVAVITTNAVDRDREVVRPDGVDYRNYLANPVVLYQHNGWTLPVGKCLWIKRTPDGQGLLAKIQFWKSPEGQDLYELYAAGFMSAFSIGFRTLDGSSPTPDEVRANPQLAECKFIHRKTELLEFSCVTIPCNPEAVVIEKSLRSTAMKSLVAEVRVRAMDDPDNDGDDDSSPATDTDDDGGIASVPIKAGNYVEWGRGRSGGCGRVRSIHTAGKVPGVENECECSTDKPGAKVRCYKMRDDGKWMATKRHMGVTVAELTRIDHEMDGAIDEPEEDETPAPKSVTSRQVKEPELPVLPPHRDLGTIEAAVISQVKSLFDPASIAQAAARSVYEQHAGYV